MKNKLSTFIYAIIIGFTVISSCKKPDETQPNAISSKTIGNNGGTLSNASNTVVLSVPAQSLPTNVTLSIKPTEDTAPSGVGKIFKLEPEGQKFDKPITLSFIYSEADAQITDPELMAVAFKKSDGTWETLANLKLDKNTRSISGQTTHFSEWSIVKVKEGLSFSTKKFTLNDMSGSFSNDTLLLRGVDQNYSFSIIFKNKLQTTDKKSPLKSFYIYPLTTSVGKFQVVPFSVPSLADTNTSFLKISSFSTGPGTYNIGSFSVLVQVTKYTSQSDTINVTSKDTLIGTFRFKQ